jgi:hypothetical protein
MAFNMFKKTRIAANQGSVLPEKDKTQDQVESAFLFKDFLSYATFLKWGVVAIVVIIIEILARLPPIKLWDGVEFWLMGPYWQATVHFYTTLIIWVFVNYLIFYFSIKLYRGFTRYIIPIIKASADLPFRLHQKLLE